MRWLFCVVLMSAAAVAGGCSGSDDKPSDMGARQDEALRDPFNYSPADRTDISGGGVMDLKTDSLLKDVNSVLNP